MRTSIWAFLAISALAGTLFFVVRPRSAEVSATAPEPQAVAAPANAATPVTQLITRSSSPQLVPSKTQRLETAPQPGAAVAAIPAKPNLDVGMVNQAVDILVSSQATHDQKQAEWKKLRDAGKLDQAITELEQRMATDPRDAAYPATLGQAYLKKCAVLKDVREQGILAMQADKVFDTALNLDPSNWEARFTKAVALSYWPPNMNKGPEVIEHFQTLIQQQEAQSPQSQFAETYAWLGDQYQKSGRTDDARATWERGATLFPADANLKSKLAAANAAPSASSDAGQ